jgi:hypothetical protein
VKLSELFEPGKHSLVIYNFMFPRDPGDTSSGPATGETALLPVEERPCPSCTALLDPLDGAVEHAGFLLGARPRRLTQATPPHATSVEERRDLAHAREHLRSNCEQAHQPAYARS